MLCASSGTYQGSEAGLQELKSTDGVQRFLSKAEESWRGKTRSDKKTEERQPLVSTSKQNETRVKDCIKPTAPLTRLAPRRITILSIGTQSGRVGADADSAESARVLDIDGRHKVIIVRR
jgi:hypothetical protein